MSTATLKREVALLRSSLAALTPTQSATLDDPIAWAERIAELTLDPWQRDVLLSAAPRSLLNATRQSGKSTAAALKAAWTVLQGGLAVVVSPSLRQSGFSSRRFGSTSLGVRHSCPVSSTRSLRSVRRFPPAIPSPARTSPASVLTPSTATASRPA